MAMNKILILVIFFALIACKSRNSDRTEKYKAVIEKYMNQRLILPDTILPVRTVDKNETYCKLKNNNKFKIITSIDGSCNVCIEQLQRWGSLIQELDTSVVFLCFMNAYDSTTMNLLLENESYKFPLILDNEHLFLRLNHIGFYDEIKTFLLDLNDNVLLVGSPVSNPQMWELYKRVITHDVLIGNM